MSKVEMDPELHRSLKSLCGQLGISMKVAMEQALRPWMSRKRTDILKRLR